jgi:putative phosphoribosyl transferase
VEVALPAEDFGAAEAFRTEITIVVDRHASLSGELLIPTDAIGIVAFAHGSDSSRLSPRNRKVARALNEAGHATLLFDLLTPREAKDRANVFDIALLASRVVAASTWLADRDECSHLPVAYFGASTGAAAALMAAAEPGARVYAVISRGGRPDLAHNLGAVRAATLLIVGGADHEVLRLNRHAYRQLSRESELAIVPGATHLFEEHGALEVVSRLAIDWLEGHRPRGGDATDPS